MIAASILFSVCVGGIVWFVAGRWAKNQELADRIAGLESAAEIPKTFAGLHRPIDEFTLDTCPTDPVSKELFLAGQRARRHHQAVKVVLRFSMALPFLMLLMYAAGGTLTYVEAA